MSLWQALFAPYFIREGHLGIMFASGRLRRTCSYATELKRGICDEMFEIQNEYVKHSHDTSLPSVEPDFIELFEVSN